MEKPIMDRTAYVPQLSLAERDRRWRAIREEMILHDLACLLIWSSDVMFGMGEANFRYVTHVGAQRISGLCIFPVEGEPIVFAAGPHMHDRPYPIYQSFQRWVKDTRAFAGMDPVIAALGKMGWERAKIGYVAAGGPFADSIPYKQFNTLLREMDRATIVDATPLLDKVRIIKSEEEIGMLEKAASIARKKVDAMIEYARPGVKECELYAKMVETGIVNGEEGYIFNMFTSGSVTEDATQHLLHGKGQPLSPTTRPLRKGDIILSEFHTQYCGYLAAVEKTLFLGPPPKELERLYGIAVESLLNGTRAMKPGATLGEVWSAFHEPVKQGGLDFLELGFHGHGVISAEYPTLIRQPRAAEDQFALASGGITSMVLRENMVLGTNVDIHDPNWRKDVGIQLGDTVVITKDGARNLVGIPLELVVPA